MKQKIVTIFFVIINIVAFLICTLSGELLYNIFSLSAQDIIERKEYYRIVSCMFMHADMEHVISNMLFVAILGEMLEKYLGHIKYFVLYMLTGIGSSLFSIAYELVSGSFYHSVGASGAVCGLIGALLVVVIKNNGRFNDISLKRVILAIIYLVYTGLKSPVVNNAAHIGGLFCGFFLMIFMYRKNNNVEQSIEN